MKKITQIWRRKNVQNILKSINLGNNYLQKIAQHLKKNPSNLLSDLKSLEDSGYISHRIEGQKDIFPFEKKVYYLNHSGSFLLKFYKDCDKFNKKYSTFFNYYFKSKFQKLKGGRRLNGKKI